MNKRIRGSKQRNGISSKNNKFFEILKYQEVLMKRRGGAIRIPP
nr:MAG TPA_asm: hypothetical protein [Caudoviricetes sp.]